VLVAVAHAHDELQILELTLRLLLRPTCDRCMCGHLESPVIGADAGVTA
jgi:hypothetical protein